MKSIFLILLFLYIFSFFSCGRDQSSNPKPPIGVSKDSITTPKPVPIFWKNICEDSRFTKLFDCNTLDCYQIELLNDPFKDLVILTVNIQDSLTDEIYYNRFSFKTHKEKNKLNKDKPTNLFPIVNNVTKDTIFCYFRGEKKIKIKKNVDVNTFFTNSIWVMPRNEENLSELDVETWNVKGRSGGREIMLSRHKFKDSTYYSNIQNILNICKINDYKYKKR
jgi:hypothetical protein